MIAHSVSLSYGVLQRPNQSGEWHGTSAVADGHAYLPDGAARVTQCWFECAVGGRMNIKFGEDEARSNPKMGETERVDAALRTD